MTGVAAILCGRDVILNDLSPAAVHIARNYTTPCDPQTLNASYESLRAALEQLESSLYGTTCEDCGGHAVIEYSIFTDVFSCPDCSSELNLWHHGRGEDGRLVNQIRCPVCSGSYRKNQLRWLRSEPCLVSYSCKGRCAARKERQAGPSDDSRLADLGAREPWHWVPQAKFGPDWEMWRQGHKERGITSVRNFFTPRNLHALAALKHSIDSVPNSRVAAALLFAFTGCVNRASKRYQWNHKRPTNVLSGTLYVSSLFYEFNVFRLFERKVRAALRMYAQTIKAEGKAVVTCGSATELNQIPSDSIDYVFTDPPFGSNIYYSDCSLLWEAWLDQFTDREQEMVVARTRATEDGGHDLASYRRLLTAALSEVRRVLKPNRWASVVFHNSRADVWQAVRVACVDSGFSLGNAVMFDKKHKSFKGIKSIQSGELVANFDVVLNLQKTAPTLAPTEDVVVTEARLIEGIRQLLASVPSDDSEKRSTPYLHSMAVQQSWNENLNLAAIDLRKFEALLQREFVQNESAWYLAGDSLLATPRQSEHA
jgi:hypothetical protein